jgi:hypothetical protein
VPRMLSLQLQKSPTPDFEEKCGTSPDNSKGIFQSGMCKFESFQVSQAFVRFPWLPKPREDRPEIRAFRVSFSSLYSWFSDLKAKSPKVSGLVREYSRFAETVGRDRF